MVPAGSLKNAREFKQVMRQGRRARRNGVVVYALSRLPEQPTRWGFAVRAERAVDRNRLKRRLRAALVQSNPGPGFDLVMGGEAEALTADFQNLVQNTKSALREAGVELAL